MALNKLQISVGNTVEKAHPNATEWEKKAMWAALANATENEAKDRNALTMLASMEIGDVIKVQEVSLSNPLSNLKNILTAGAKYALSKPNSCKMMHLSRLFHLHYVNPLIADYNKQVPQGQALTFTSDEKWLLAGNLAENHKDALEKAEQDLALERELLAKWSVTSIRKTNITSGGHFFDTDTMKAWGDTVRDFERYIKNGKVILRNKKNGKEYVFNTEYGTILSKRD